MSFIDILKRPRSILAAYPLRFALVAFFILGATIYPTDLEKHYGTPKNGADSAFVVGIENYGRHINTIAPLAIAVFTRDVIGLKQMLVITLTGIVATHGPKRLLDDVTIAGTRLGQRPYSPDSQHNMPSGHSALAASGAMIMWRRYGVLLGVLGVFVTVLTMYGRYMLDKHTISATISGALIGGVIAVIFATRKGN